MNISGEWTLLTGNQIGAILGAANYEKARAAGVPASKFTHPPTHDTYHDVKRDSIDKIAMVASTVSSKFLARMAEVEGFRFEEALTGFKWIGNKAMELEREGYTVVFAFEEAIGFTVGDIVKDKDGVSALAVFSEWAVQLKKRGMTPYQYLESLYAKYGYFVSDNSYFICGDKALIGQIFKRIRHFVSGNGCYFHNSVLTMVVIVYVGKQQRRGKKRK